VAIRASIGSRKQAILLGVLAIVLVLAVVRWRPGGKAAPSPSAPAARRAGEATQDDPVAARTARSKARDVSPDEVPILSPEDFAVHAGRGSYDPGRDLFDLREPTRRPPPTPFPPPPPPGDTRFIGPLPPPPPTPTPKPPEVTFKFVGTFGPKGHPIAVIQQGDLVYNVRAGDVLFDKFVLRSVGYESIEVGFVGFPDGETRRIGITP
jgi:hypothetical protein